MAEKKSKPSVCFVCLGNICRSPTAEAIFRALAEEQGIAHQIFIDSAGTAREHAGEAPDPRSAAAALKRGVTLAGYSRQFNGDDFARFSWIVAMDAKNLRDIKKVTGAENYKGRLCLLRDFDPKRPGDVPDPYIAGSESFDAVFDVCDRSCRELLKAVMGG